MSIANAVVASREVRPRAIEKKKDNEHEEDDDDDDNDIVAIQEDIDNIIFGVQVSRVPSNKSTKVWSSRPDHE